jgi:hypothetical protein
MKHSTSVSGFITRGSYLLVPYMMTLTPVSYILAMRQINVVLGALLGSAVIFARVYILGVLA